MYLLSSCFTNEELFALDEDLLGQYFQYLEHRIKEYHPKIDSLDLIEEWRSLYKIAWADFSRFLEGWNPKHYKLHSYAKSQTEKALAQIK